MTQPVQIAFLFEEKKPKVFLRTLLYATGKRGYVIEGLYVKLKHGNVNHTFGFWGYGERNNLMPAGGLQIGEAGAAYNHHFLEIDPSADFEFLTGQYELSVYARIVGKSAARLLCKVSLRLSADYSPAMAERMSGILFTWDPDLKEYRASLSDRPSRLTHDQGIGLSV